MKTKRENRIPRLWGLASLCLVGLAWFWPLAGIADTDPLVEVSTFAQPAGTELPARIRLVSYNLHGPLTARIDDIVEVLEGHPAIKDAAVFALQEVNRHHRDSGYKDMVRVLASRLKVHYAYGVENPYKEGGGVRGLALLSRFPLSHVERTVLPHPGPGGRRRIALGATVHIGEKLLRVYTTHLETRISVKERAGQVMALLKQAEVRGGPATIILGDFNTITAGATNKMTELMEGAGFVSALQNDGYTFQRALILRLRLDWIWTRNLRIAGAGVERDVTPSDHRPIWVDIDVSLSRGRLHDPAGCG